MYHVFPFSDYDHLMKTIHNRIYTRKIKINGHILDWNILVEIYTNLPSDLKSKIHADNITLKDKMNSHHLRMIYSKELSDYIISKSVFMDISAQKIDYFHLGIFLCHILCFLVEGY